MKKHILAVAVAAAVAAPAMAQNVTVYGLMDLGFTQIDTENTARAAPNTVTKISATQTGNQGRMSGSRFGVRGAEDLGGGIKAAFTLEFGVDPSEQANGIGNGTRLGFMELSNTLGTLSIGRQVSSTKFVNDTFSAQGNPNFVTGYVPGAGLSTSTTSQSSGDYAASNNASTIGGLGNANAGERISNLIRYTSPNINGLQGTIGYYKTNTDTATTAAVVIGDANGRGIDAGLRYSQGPLSLSIGYNKYETLSAANTFGVDNVHVALGASYDFGFAKAFISNNSRDYTTATAADKTEFKDTTVGAQIPMGNAMLIASYGTGSDDRADQETSKRGYQLGAVYNLSKRTNLYAIYGSGSAKSETTGTTTNQKVNETGYAFGIRHTF